MLRKLLGVFGLLFAIGCCCVGERMAKKPEADVGLTNWPQKDKDVPSHMTPDRIKGGIAP